MKYLNIFIGLTIYHRCLTLIIVPFIWKMPRLKKCLYPYFEIGPFGFTYGNLEPDIIGMEISIDLQGDWREDNLDE